jgi:hypothetical protein
MGMDVMSQVRRALGGFSALALLLGVAPLSGTAEAQDVGCGGCVPDLV